MSSRHRAQNIAIVGGGISGLAAAVFTRKRFPNAQILLFESRERLGGVVSTDAHEQLSLERGPLSIAADDPKIWELLEALELTEALQPSDGLGERYIYVDGKLRKISFDPRGLVREGLLSRRGAARAMMEPMIPRARAKGDEQTSEAVWDFFARRFGSEVAERLVQPMLLGISTGETRDTDMQTLFPNLTQREAESGSVLGAFAMDRLRKRPQSSVSQYWLRKKGLQMIGDAVAELPGVQVHLNTAIQRVEAGQHEHPDSPGGYTLYNDSGEAWSADELILATPSFVSGRLLNELAPEAARKLRSIDYYGMALVHFVYRRKDLEHLPPRLQFLVDRGQGLRMIGGQWTSDLFPDKAPHELAVLRCHYGGEFDRTAFELTRANLIRTARVELATILGLDTIPLQEHVVVWPKAVPHFRPGHQQLRAQIQTQLSGLPNLHVIGSGMSGMSVAACVQGGWDAAEGAGV